MFLIENGTTDKLTQYQCKNIPQVKNIINSITKTNSNNKDWENICKLVKKGNSDSVDYTCFVNGKEKDCLVNIGYDNSCKSYYVWIELLGD